MQNQASHISRRSGTPAGTLHMEKMSAAQLSRLLQPSRIVVATSSVRLRALLPRSIRPDDPHDHAHDDANEYRTGECANDGRLTGAPDKKFQAQSVRPRPGMETRGPSGY